LSPEGYFLNWQQDPQSNWLARVVYPEKVTEFSVDVEVLADMAVVNPFDFFLEPEAETVPFAYAAEQAHELAPFRLTQQPGPLLAAYLRTITMDGTQHTADFLVGLNQRLQGDISYTIRMEPGVQTPEETLGLKSGSCRDSAWLLVQILRHLGFAARFVSGYLVQLVPDVKALDGPVGAAADFTDLHAWTEVYLPGAGWIGLDPTSGLLTGEGHIPLAASPDPTSAAPISGGVEMCEVTFSHHMEVIRAAETPRVTKPYTDEQWDEILALGDHVDSLLAQGDVRLTQGGEPTFVSAVDMDGEEWNVAAVGPTKQAHADALIRRLRERTAPGALITHGQGKWYPGESLPRWAFTMIWRDDDEPVWRDADLIATDATRPNPTFEQVAAFSEHLAQALEVDEKYLHPIYEDSAHYLLKENVLPTNVDPIDSKLADPEERARLARVFRLGLDKPIGMVLPLQPWQARDSHRWLTGPWPTRAGRLLAIPGDSPLGFRLPLESLPWISAADYPWHHERDSFEPRGPLPPVGLKSSSSHPQGNVRRVPGSAQAPAAIARQRLGSQVSMPKETPKGLVSEQVRTALCIQPRDGRINVFLPPVETAEQYLDLVASVETAAQAIGQPVRIEGYPAPHDPRLHSVKVTPDPGVIEVNVAPTGTFAEQLAQLETLYEQARLARLSTESFDVDGTHGGTGGGNHITLGGITPADSPLLRRPDLLVSLLTYWQRHPSLSYLFAGRFVGTTSQAPRVDEGRSEALYELEIAFAEIARLAEVGASKPWVTDRALRHLLTDITGNTHRAEFCIDKLYSPDSPRGRLGLLELRGFEMPPHHQMAMVQSLLVRSLVAWFWDEPLRAPLIRHGDNLHGRYLLPHFLIHDIADVAADLRAHGVDFDTSWLDPFTEFRFPRIGTAVFDGVELELRGGIEPWNVLGEESTAGGTARYVDSSVERVQVRLIGADRHRYVVTANDHPIPLLATDKADVQVGGVRYRAWQPPSALHPTITVDAPLRFELVDVLTGTSKGGCTYHVAHPGGRAYDTPPVNAVEAESRRGRRFEVAGFTPGRMDLADIREKQARQSTDLGAPGILDLRRVRTVLR
jgi:uncharacterized protein (DUF2126 family)